MNIKLTPQHSAFAGWCAATRIRHTHACGDGAGENEIHIIAARAWKSPPWTRRRFSALTALTPVIVSARHKQSILLGP